MAQAKLFHGQNPTITIRLERLQPSYDGVNQLLAAIGRLINQWNDVWGDYSFSVSDTYSGKDWSTPVTSNTKRTSLTGMPASKR